MLTSHWLEANAHIAGAPLTATQFGQSLAGRLLAGRYLQRQSEPLHHLIEIRGRERDQRLGG